MSVSITLLSFSAGQNISMVSLLQNTQNYVLLLALTYTVTAKYSKCKIKSSTAQVIITKYWVIPEETSETQLLKDITQKISHKILVSSSLKRQPST